MLGTVTAPGTPSRTRRGKGTGPPPAFLARLSHFVVGPEASKFDFVLPHCQDWGLNLGSVCFPIVFLRQAFADKMPAQQDAANANRSRLSRAHNVKYILRIHCLIIIFLVCFSLPNINNPDNIQLAKMPSLCLRISSSMPRMLAVYRNPFFHTHTLPVAANAFSPRYKTETCCQSTSLFAIPLPTVVCTRLYCN